MAKLVARILAKTGKHRNKQGQERYNEIVVANIFQNEIGQQSVKFLSLPVGDWNGWAWMVRPDYETENLTSKSNSIKEISGDAEKDDQTAFL